MMKTLLLNGAERRERLFPGFLFVVISDQWRSLCSTRGVHRLYTQNEAPCRIPTEEIDYFRRLEDKDGFVVLPSPVQVRSSVVVQRGPHAGLRGVVSSMDAQMRCRILSTILGRQVEVTVDRRALALA